MSANKSNQPSFKNVRPRSDDPYYDSLPEQYDPVMDNLEICLMKNEEDPNYLTLDSL